MSTMMRFLTLAIVATIGLANQSPAAEPALEMRVQSVKQLLSNAEYLGSLFDQAEAAKQFKAFIEQTGNGESGFEGIDIDKPVGLYAFVEKDVNKSRVTLMIPVKDKEAMLNAIKQRLNLTPEIEEGGHYIAHSPDFPQPIFLRFSDGYLHATTPNRAAIMPNMLLKPAQFFAAKQTTVASLIVRLDEVPADIRTTFFGLFEFGYTEQMNKNLEPGTYKADVLNFASDLFLGALKQVVMEGQDLKATFDVKPELDEFDLKVTFDGQADSDLQKTLTSWKGRSSVAKRINVPKNPLLQQQAHFALTEPKRIKWAELVEKTIEQELAKIDDGVERNISKTAIDAVKPTLKAGVLDFGLIATETDKGLNSVVAIKVVKGTEIAKTVQTFSLFAEKKDVEFKFNIEEINGVKLHKVTIKDENFAKLTGTKFVWLGTSDDILLASVEENGEAIRKAAQGDAGSSPISKTELSMARFLTFIEKINPNEPFQETAKVTFGEKGPKGLDTIKFDVTGGETMTIQLKTKGSLARFFFQLDQLKKQNTEQ